MYSGNALVSVVMCVYNREEYLKYSVKSVLEQTYTNLEFIIVDDGSTDGTREQLEQIKDARVRVICLPENRHISHATNVGREQAKGAYIAIMDSDDVWEKDKLMKQLTFLEEHPEFEGCFTWAELIDKDGNVCGEDKNPLRWLLSCKTDTREDWLRFFFFQGNRLTNPSALFTRKAMETVGRQNEFYLQAQDMEWWIRFAKRFSFGILEEKLVNYRIEAGNTSEFAEEFAPSRIRFYNEMLQLRLRFFDDMSDELFIRTFQKFFVCADSASPEELECEKALLMLHPLQQCKTPAAIALVKIEELMQNPDMADLLKHKYHFGTREIGNYTEQNLYFDSYAEKVKSNCAELESKCAPLERKCAQMEEQLYGLRVKNEILDANVKHLEARIRQMELSTVK